MHKYFPPAIISISFLLLLPLSGLFIYSFISQIDLITNVYSKGVPIFSIIRVHFIDLSLILVSLTAILGMLFKFKIGRWLTILIFLTIPIYRFYTQGFIPEPISNPAFEYDEKSYGQNVEVVAFYLYNIIFILLAFRMAVSVKAKSYFERQA